MGDSASRASSASSSHEVDVVINAGETVRDACERVGEDVQCFDLRPDGGAVDMGAVGRDLSPVGSPRKPWHTFIRVATLQAAGWRFERLLRDPIPGAPGLVSPAIRGVARPA